MAEIVCLSTAEDRRDHIHRSVQLLSDGEIIGLPTETGYVLVAHALHLAAVQRLRELAGSPIVLVCRSSDDASDYLPVLTRIGDKLLRRAWPGPLQMVLPEAVTEGGLLKSLPDDGRSVLSKSELRVRVSSGDVLIQVGKLLPGPLVVTDESTQPKALSAQALAATYGDVPTLILDGGSPRFADGLTVVTVQDDDVSVTHPGVIAQESVQRLTSEVFLFVCTGNTCRSPMAEGLFRHKLAQRIGCPEQELANHGFYVASAGISAGYGMSASPESAELLRHRGIDLSMHASQPLTERLLIQADFIYTMTRGHRRSILEERPDLADRVQLLAADGSDVPDPIGGGLDEYKRCQRAIEQHLDTILNQLVTRPKS